MHSGPARRAAGIGCSSVRIVKKTLKGDLLGKTGYKKVGAGKGRPDEGEGPAADAGPAVKPRGQKSLDDLQPGPDDLVVVSEPLRRNGGAAVPPPSGPSAPAAASAPPPPASAPAPAIPPLKAAALRARLPKREASLEEMRAAAEAELDVASTHVGVAASAGGRRGNVAQVRDGGVPVKPSPVVPAAPAPPPPPPPAPAHAAPSAGSMQAQHAAPQTIIPGAPPLRAPAAPPAPPPPAKHKLPPGSQLEGDAVQLARAVLAEALYRDFGAPGSKLQHARGGSFQVQSRFGDGVVRTQHDLLLPLPAGHVAPHTADLIIELEPQGLLVLDIVPSQVSLLDLKARAFDALQMRRLDRCFSVLVFVRAPGAGISEGQAQAVGHGYDVHYGIDAEHVHSEAKFQALRTRILTWLEAASSANRGFR